MFKSFWYSLLVNIGGGNILVPRVKRKLMFQYHNLVRDYKNAQKEYKKVIKELLDESDFYEENYVQSKLNLNFRFDIAFADDKSFLKSFYERIYERESTINHRVLFHQACEETMHHVTNINTLSKYYSTLNKLESSINKLAKFLNLVRVFRIIDWGEYEPSNKRVYAVNENYNLLTEIEMVINDESLLAEVMGKKICKEIFKYVGRRVTYTLKYSTVSVDYDADGVTEFIEINNKPIVAYSKTDRYYQPTEQVKQLRRNFYKKIFKEF